MPTARRTDYICSGIFFYIVVVVDHTFIPLTGKIPRAATSVLARYPQVGAVCMYGKIAAREMLS